MTYRRAKTSLFYLIGLSVLLACVVVSGCKKNTSASASTASYTSPNGVTLNLKLVTASGNPTSVVSNSAPGTLVAQLTKSDGSRMQGVLVAFKTDFAVLNPSSGTALTNTNGEASIQLLPGTGAGAGQVSAEAIVGTETLDVKLSFSVAESVASGSSLTAVLHDPSGTATTLVRADSPGVLTATLTNSAGAPVSGVIVTFDTKLASINPDSGTAITNSSGQASIQLLYKDKTGADAVKITATIGSESLVVFANYQVGPPAISIGNGIGSSFANGVILLGASPLSAGGTTSVTVSIVDTNHAAFTTPIDVNFTSGCVKAAKSTLDATVATVNGIASATYKAQGCVGTDTITATALFGGSTFTATANLAVSSDTVGSLEFISATPTLIAIKGTGGAGLGETSTVTFRVKGTQGLVLPNQLVTFALNTSVGGINLGQASGYTNADGEVSTVVRAGTVSTSARVTATIDLGGGVIIAVQSDQLTISTGIPDQDSTSIALSVLNPEAWDHDGVQVDVIAHLADHFNNPVPDGTAVYFTTESGSVGSQCLTVKGACTVKWTSQNPRPVDHRSTVMAVAVGNESFRDKDGDGYYSNGDGEPYADITHNGIYDEPFTDANANGIFDEPFTDTNANGVYDFGEPFVDYNRNGRYDGAGNNPAGEVAFVDRNGNGIYDGSGTLAAGDPYTDANANGAFDAPGFADLPEAFLDENENGVWDIGEPYWDFNGNGQYDGRDGKYSGVLCKHTTLCAASQTIHVRNSVVLVMSSSASLVVAQDNTTRSDVYGSNNPSIAVNKAVLDVTGTSKTLRITVTDTAGQTMANGTTISVSSDIGKLTGTTSILVGNTNVPLPPFTVTLADDDPGSNAVGTLSIVVTSPDGTTSTVSFAVAD